MKTIFKNITMIILLFTGLTQAQTAEKVRMHFDGTEYKVISIYHEVVVEASEEKIWKAIAHEYATIGDFHSGLISSYQVKGTPSTGIGAKRHCQIDKKMSVKEEIKIFDESKKMYSYDVYEFKKFPGRVFRYDMGVKRRGGKNYLYGRLSYRLKPGFMTGFMKGRMKKTNIENILVYKNYIENNDSSKPNAKKLRKDYEASLKIK